MSRVPHVGASGWPFIKTMVTREVVDSTSTLAAELVREHQCALPLVVWARTQTHGRGRGSHQWWSDHDSLTLTLAVDAREHGLSVEVEPRLALATAVAIISALNDLGLGSPALGIRWPNDIEADGRKLGGILPERVETPRGHVTLVGIGLNVRTNLTLAPPDVRAMATSLASLHATPLDETIFARLVTAILSQLECVLPRLAIEDRTLAHEWCQLDLLRNRWVHVDLGTHRVAGWGQGIDDQGALCLHDGHHRQRVFGGQVIRDTS